MLEVRKIWKKLLQKLRAFSSALCTDWTKNTPGLLRALHVDIFQKQKPDTPACDQFDPAPPDESAFATKEYLSKELLQYLLSLELLPKIEDAAELTWYTWFYVFNDISLTQYGIRLSS